jgi:hypothetical protein
VWFVFYMPVPELTAWYKQERILKQQGIPSKHRPPKPPLNPQYATKQELALCLLEQCKEHRPDLKV